MLFVIMWFMWLGDWLKTVGQLAIATGNFTGMEAFFISNLNFVVFIVMILGMIGYYTFMGGGD